MSVLIVLIIASLAVGLVFLGAFIWSVRSGQYEDTLTPSMRILPDDSPLTDSLPNFGSHAVSLPQSKNQREGGHQKQICNEK